MPEIVLASGSATRASLLKSAGVRFTVHIAPVDERAVELPLLQAGAPPDVIATTLADAKALAVSRARPDALVIGADQVLDLAGERLVKPRSHQEASEQLRRLAGRSHRLPTGVAVAHANAIQWRHLEGPSLVMRRLTASEIDAYLTRVGNAALASVGAYQIEGLGIQLFDRIDGDYFAILGLPLLPLLDHLRAQGALALADGSR